MNHASLFTGIGGFDLAAEWMNWENIFQVEIDPFCQKVLEKNFPNVKRYGDIKEFDGTKYRGTIDVLSGGFPCQPFSVAGKRKGKKDDRFLWPEMLRVIMEVKPSFIVGENVTGIIGMALEQVLTEVEAEGYHTETFIIPACGVNAPHKRDRVWIIAHSNSYAVSNKPCEVQSEATKNERETQRENWQWLRPEFSSIRENVSNTDSEGLQAFREQTRIREEERKTCASSKRGSLLGGEWGSAWWDIEPGMGRVANGIPRRMDRIKALGNSVVPQIVYQIFKAIEQVKWNQSN